MTKRERHAKLLRLLEDNPFLADQDLSTLLQVSIQTVRLDRTALGIPELRERIRDKATTNYEKVSTLSRSEIMGDLVSIQPQREGISIMQTDTQMAFRKSRIIKGYYLFAMAESLALAVVNRQVALSGVANIKYSVPVQVGEVLIAKATVAQIKNEEYYVHVKVSVHEEQVFRAKFLMRGIGES